MVRHLFFALFMLLVATAPAREKPEDWLEVRTVNFVVISNANQKQAPGVADQV